MAQAAKHPSAEHTASVERQVSAENSTDSPLVQHLRRQVATAFVLYLNYKHYHWQTYGPLFRDLHKLFDDFADEVVGTIDPFAERIRMIGQDPPAHASAMADLAGVAPAAPHSTMREMMEEARRNLLEVIKDMREGARLADERDDPGTVDLYSRFVQIHEKHEWWVRDILRTDDGLCK